MEVDMISVNKGFSKQAPTFDEEDASNSILQWMRGRVRRHLSKRLTSPNKILEINAGTGLDAVYLARQDHYVHASDLSSGMIAEIKKKVMEYDLQDRISVQQLSFRHLDQIENAPFDLIFSNFGGLNCIHDIGEVSKNVRYVLKPGGYITMVIMPRVCPWEIGLVFKGNFKRAFRRFKKGGSLAHIEGERFMTYYFSPGDVQKAFGSDFKMVALEGLGSFCPPPHIKSFPWLHPTAFKWLTRTDEILSGVYPFDRWADHFIVTLQYAPHSRPAGRALSMIPSYADVNLRSTETTPNTNGYRVFSVVKAVFDITFSLFFCVFILSWLIPLLAILIKMDSKGPVFFLQKRTGYANKDFICIKLRTMYINDTSDSEQAIYQDFRITRFGKFLRDTNLDELPQFINVLKGEMSVIGPRPHMIHDTGQFSKTIERYNERHQVKPGMTGLAQVKGWKGYTPTFRSINKRVQWDLFYVRHRSIRLDAYIVMATFREMFSNLWIELFK